MNRDRLDGERGPLIIKRWYENVDRDLCCMLRCCMTVYFHILYKDGQFWQIDACKSLPTHLLIGSITVLASLYLSYMNLCIWGFLFLLVWSGLNWKKVISCSSMHQSGFNNILIKIWRQFWGCLLMFPDHSQSNQIKPRPHRHDDLFFCALNPE